jgi:hypothetical protein
MKPESKVASNNNRSPSLSSLLLAVFYSLPTLLCAGQLSTLPVLSSPFSLFRPPHLESALSLRTSSFESAQYPHTANRSAFYSLTRRPTLLAPNYARFLLLSPCSTPSDARQLQHARRQRILQARTRVLFVSLSAPLPLFSRANRARQIATLTFPALRRSSHASWIGMSSMRSQRGSGCWILRQEAGRLRSFVLNLLFLPSYSPDRLPHRPSTTGTSPVGLPLPPPRHPPFLRPLRHLLPSFHLHPPPLPALNPSVSANPSFLPPVAPLQGRHLPLPHLPSLDHSFL